MIEGDVSAGTKCRETAREGRGDQADRFSRCESGIGTEIIHGMNYLETRRDLASNAV